MHDPLMLTFSGIVVLAALWLGLVIVSIMRRFR